MPPPPPPSHPLIAHRILLVLWRPAVAQQRAPPPGGPFPKRLASRSFLKARRRSGTARLPVPARLPGPSGGGGQVLSLESKLLRLQARLAAAGPEERVRIEAEAAARRDELAAEKRAVMRDWLKTLFRGQVGGRLCVHEGEGE